MKTTFIFILLLCVGSAFGSSSSEDEKKLFCKATFDYTAYNSSDVMTNYECGDIQVSSVGNMRKLEGRISGGLNNKKFSSKCNFYYLGEPKVENIVGGIEMLNCEEI